MNLYRMIKCKENVGALKKGQPNLSRRITRLPPGMKWWMQFVQAITSRANVSLGAINFNGLLHYIELSVRFKN